MRSLEFIHVLTISSVHLGIAVGAKVATRSHHVVKESHNVPRDWSNLGPAPAQHMIQLQIGLKQENFDELEKHLYEGKELCAPFPSLSTG